MFIFLNSNNEQSLYPKNNFNIMAGGTILDQLVKAGTVEQILKKNSTDQDAVKALKQILFELGFDEVKNLQSNEIDGNYDDETIATVKSFCNKNDITSDGEKITEEIAEMILKRYESLPDMLQLHHDLVNGKISEKYFEGSPDKQAIASLQRLLNDLGFGKELNWDKNRNNGDFGKDTQSAIKAFLEQKVDKVAEKVPVIKKIESFFDGCGSKLSHLMKKGGLSTILKKGAPPHEAIKELQQSLHKLGFGKLLGKPVEKLDNVFGDNVVNAVKDFAEKNGIKTDGTKITQAIAGTIQDRLKDLPFLHQLQRDFREGKVAKKYFKGSKDKIAISALQQVLNGLGKGKELNWNLKGNDGVFDGNVAKALKSYLNKGFFNGAIKKVTPQTMFSIIKDASKNLGPDWADHVQAMQGNDNSVLTRFAASNFIGIHVITNVAFVPALEKINGYAVKNKVQVYVTNAYRRGTDVPGAIVPPAEMSNHKVGHAIDMNLKYGDGKLANSVYMHPSNRDNWAEPVRGFLDDIINDSTLRWGGEFKRTDPVHIDDNLNHTDPDEWHKERELTIKAYDSNDIKDWTPS